MLAECSPCMRKGNAECDLSVMSDAAESSVCVICLVKPCRMTKQTKLLHEPSHTHRVLI